MQVGVVESRHHEVTAEVDHLGLWPFEFLNIPIFSDREYAISAHRKGLFTVDGGELIVRRSSRINIAMDINHICLRTLSRRRGGRILCLHEREAIQQK